MDDTPQNYRDGFKMAMSDYPNSRRPLNPHTKGTVEHQDWANGYQDGWNRAYMEHRWRGSRH